MNEEKSGYLGSMKIQDLNEQFKSVLNEAAFNAVSDPIKIGKLFIILMKTK